jgi:TPR repeat protein
MCQEDASNVIFRHRSDQLRRVLCISLARIIQVVRLHLTIVLIFCLGAVSAAVASSNGASSAKSGQALDVKQLLLQANKGDKAAEMALGNLYYRGLGVPKDQAQAFRWYMECAKQGDPEAEAYVGAMYANGLGVDRNFENSLEWLRRSSAQGSPRGEFELAVMYLRGFGTQDERGQLMALVSKSASQHYAPAESQLGVFAYNGNGRTADHHRALRYFLMAAYGNNVVADYYLAKMYFEGDSVKQDNVIAYAFVEQAAYHEAAGDREEIDQIKDLQKRMKAKLPPKDLADADELVSDTYWKGQGLVNVAGLHVYQATGKSLLGSDDPLHDAGIGPAVINIDEKGSVSLFGRPVDLTALKQKLETFFDNAPLPDVRVFIKGFPPTDAANRSYYAVLADIKEMKLRIGGISTTFGGELAKESSARH